MAPIILPITSPLAIVGTMVVINMTRRIFHLGSGLQSTHSKHDMRMYNRVFNGENGEWTL